MVLNTQVINKPQKGEYILVVSVSNKANLLVTHEHNKHNKSPNITLVHLSLERCFVIMNSASS